MHSLSGDFAGYIIYIYIFFLFNYYYYIYIFFLGGGDSETFLKCYIYELECDYKDKRYGGLLFNEYKTDYRNNKTIAEAGLD